MADIDYSGYAVVSLPVSNLDKSERWYSRTLGMATTRKLEDPPWCEMSTAIDGVLLGLAEVDKVRVGDATLTLTVNDVNVARTQLIERGADVSEVLEIENVARVVTLLDLDGNALMLRETLQGDQH